MELQQFGWNAVTVGFVGAVFFVLVELWGLWLQNRAVWRAKSAQSISVACFVYLAALFMSGFIYGVETKSIALMTSLPLSLIHIPILLGVWKFKGFSGTEKFITAGLAVVLVVMAIAPAKDWFFLLFSLGSAAALVGQPYEIWKNRDAGVVEITLLLVYLVSTVFWVIYGYAIHDWVLRITTPIYLAILVLTAVLWFRYRPRRNEASTA